MGLVPESRNCEAIIQAWYGGEKAGEHRDIAIDLPMKNFETWDDATNTMRVVGGEHEIMVGTSCDHVKSIKVNL